MGKSRIAKEVARSEANHASVRWVDLTSLSPTSSIAEVVSIALGVDVARAQSRSHTVLDASGPQSILMVLDNCEHLTVPVGNFIIEMLAHAPAVRVLATSREPLAIEGETTYSIPPLTLPTSGGPESEFAESEAVALFVDRAQAVVPDFELTESNAHFVVELCRALDGMPLALELAAARLRTLSPRQVIDKIGDRFTLLTGGNRTATPRQQTLRAVVDWSYDLCTDSERELWALLSVFPGSFELDAAESVGSSGSLCAHDVLDVLGSLVAKSLVVVDRSSACWRYSQLMTLREYGREMATALGLVDASNRAHRDHYLERCESGLRKAHDRVPSNGDHIAWCRVEHGNLTAALHWSTQHVGETGGAVRIAVGLLYHWISGGVLQDARRCLDELLLTMSTPTRQCGDVLWVTAWTALVQGDLTYARKLLRRCEAVSQTLGDSVLLAHHDHVAALAALFGGDTHRSVELYRRAIATYRSAELPERLNATFQLAIALIYAGQPEETLELCRTIVENADTEYGKWNTAFALWVSGLAHLHLGRPARAFVAAREAVTVQLGFQDRICCALSIEVLAWSAEAQNDHAESAALFGAADHVWNELGTTVGAFGPGLAKDSRSSRAQAKAALGDRRFDELSGLTPRESIGAVLTFALENHADSATTQAVAAKPLTIRETEVAVLVATGLRNRQIAEELVVSPRTVDGHIERILRKLDMKSRAQLGAWVQKNVL
ncbi:ATP-binding protein [Rhodococcus sovatensis]